MSIAIEALRRGISRLCHFTDSRNLAHMHDGADAIQATADLLKAQQAIFHVTDVLRIDGHADKVCCSIEYPNAWYFDVARKRDPIFADWVVLLIDPERLSTPGTMFCPCNAAKGGGAYIQSGGAAFSALFAARALTGRRRHTNQLLCSPTDDQAEVLVPGPIGLSELLGVGVADEAQAKREYVRLEQLGHRPSRFRWIIAPHFFQKLVLSAAIRRGERPVETVWLPV